MSAIFMFLLFSLNIFTIFAVIVLYLRQNRLSKLEKDQKATIMEMEELLTGYLMEMKEENEALIKAVTQASAHKSPDHTEGQAPMNRIIVEQKTKQTEGWIPPLKEAGTSGVKLQAANAYKNQVEKGGEYHPPIGVEDKLELSNKSSESIDASVLEKDFAVLLNESLEDLSLNDQVSFLVNQGLSIEEVAKKLDRGQTEIELLIKFQKNK